jgi:dTDP-4-amino-4,6-dideoxygalactose transaminase
LKKIASFVGSKFVVSFNSGTSALFSALVAYDIKDYEVIVPSFTFISTANAVMLAGGKPVFCESESETFGLDICSVVQKVSPKTKAVINIQYGGSGSRDTEKIRAFCKENNIIFIEDAAESLGAKIHGKFVGTFGDAGMFSLCQNKIISCGEGGVIVTDSQELYERLILLRSHGRVDIEGQDYFSSINDSDYICLGYNFRLSSALSALASSQLDKIEKIIEKRKEVAEIYDYYLRDVEEIRCPIKLPGFSHIYQMYSILLPDEKKRNSLQKFLESERIMTKVYFFPIHLKSFYKTKYDYKTGDLKNTENISNRILTLPIYVNMSKDDILFVIEKIKEFFAHG